MSDVLEKIVEKRTRDLRQEYDAKLAEMDRSLEEKDRKIAQLQAFIQHWSIGRRPIWTMCWQELWSGDELI